MQDTYSELTPEKSNSIGEFEYAPGKIFSPFVGKQKNGNTICSREMYELLKDTEQFKRVDWSGSEWVTKEELDFEAIKL